MLAIIDPPCVVLFLHGIKRILFFTGGFMESQKNMLEEARGEINEIDREIARLFEKRMSAARRVAEYKKEHGLQIFDKAREEQLIERNASYIENDGIREYYVSFLKATMEVSKEYQRRLIEGMRVAFSGVKGAFGYIAAKRIFPEGTPVPYSDFKSAYQAVEKGECDCAVLPLENSFEGDVAQVMDLSYFGSLHINGVFDLAVEQHLFGTPDSSLDSVKTVMSHPQALAQCADYTENKRLLTVQCVNTAVAAKEVAEKGDKSFGVICSLEAGERYSLKLLDRKINSDSSNTTRFAVFSRTPADVKSSAGFIMMFTVKDEAGSLTKALSVFGEEGYNLKALKSRPSKEVIWNYYFLLEAEGALSDEKQCAITEKLKGVCTNVKLLGKFGKEVRL